MQKMYASMQADNANEMVVGLAPIVIGDIEFFGCKKLKLVDYQTKDENDKEVTKQKVDNNVPVEYDSLTQLFMGVDNSKLSNAQLLTQLAKQQLINAQLLSEIAHLKGSIK